MPQFDDFAIDEEVIDIAKKFRSNGFELYMVGGVVRDFFLGKKSDDIDFATNATPYEVMKMFRCIETGLKHGTVTIVYKRKFYECTTFRLDNDYEDFRHPNNVDFTRDIHEDLKRRDFTINAMTVNILEHKIVDDFDGLKDIDKKIIKTVGEPSQRFDEDALRMLRAVRFASCLGFNIEEKTLQSIKEKKHLICRVSKERIAAELTKMLEGDGADKALEILCDTRLLNEVLPCLDTIFTDLNKLKILENHLHKRIEDKEQIFEIRLALIASFMSIDEMNIFLRTLKLSNKIQQTVMLLVLTKLDNRKYSRIELKKILQKVREENINVFLSYNKIINNRSPNILQAEAEIKDILQKKEPYCIKMLSVTGLDFISRGKEGKDIAKGLNLALDEVIKNPPLNLDKKKLIDSVLMNWD